MLSIHHRGTPEDPGLVLALDKAEATDLCAGLALRVDEREAEHVLQELRARELISSAYVERWVDLPLADGRRARAVTYVVDRDHAQYCCYGLDQQAEIIARAVGGRGPNPEYLFKTADMLRDLGIPDPQLDYLAKKVANLTKSA
jgi:cation transport protein ChaC